MSRYIGMYVAGLAVLIAALALAVRSELSWAPAVVVGGFVLLTGTFTMRIKRSRARATRSTSPDSIEAVHDVNARAAVFVDITVALSVVLALLVIVPEIHGAIIVLLLLIGLVLDYWIRRGVVRAS